ncbi:uncharacterized protein DUF748 [Paraburkholderia caballeronis]|uniref:DUF748 domain-containing protein n=1 Tax=Paraburkholderia caballeronis TaxID=416943 RepID=UPI0010653DA5|nr:DUF748 domain-containing protein [Paraburkholderia caballeronis]TDV27732.1 uncharacterized protein DUF748 [Paraburkholderia caballeronis]
MASINKATLTSSLQSVRAVARAPRTRRIVIGVAIFVVVFGLLGFFAAPPLIRSIAAQQLGKQLDRPVTIGRIALNPYTLNLEADRVHVGERGGNGNFFDVERLVVRASWASLFRAAPIVNEVRLDSPRLAIVRLDAQRFNFTDLIEKFASTPSQPGSKSTPFSVSNIRIENGRIDFDDRLLNEKHVIDRWSVGIPFIATLPSKTDIFVEPLLRARIDGNTTLAIDGRTKPFAASRESEVTLRIDALDVPRLLTYAPAKLPVAVHAGKLSTDLKLAFVMSGEKPSLRVSGTADLNGVDTADARTGSPFFAARGLHVAASSLEPFGGAYRFDEIRLDGPDVHLARDKAGALSVQQMFAQPAGASASAPAAGGAQQAAALPASGATAAVPPSASGRAAAPAVQSPASGSTAAAATQPPASATTAAAPPPASGSTSTAAGSAMPDVSIRRFTLTDGTVRLRDESTAPPVDLVYSNVAATLTNFSTVAKPVAQYTFSTAVPDGGSIAASGSFGFAAKTADAKITVQALSLPRLQPYLDGVSAAQIVDGKLGADTTLNANWGVSPVALQVGQSTLNLQSLKVTTRGAKAPSIALAQGQLQVTKVDVAARDAQIAAVDATGLDVNVERRKDGSIDLAQLAGSPHEAAPPRAAARTQKKPAEAAAPAWHYRIDELNLKDSAVNFTDSTTPRPVKVSVSPLQLKVQKISDDLGRPLPVELKATLNRKGTLSIDGDVNPTPLKTTLKIDANRLDAAAFEPYFGSQLNAVIASALLNAKGQLAVTQGKALTASYRGDAALVDVRMLDKATSDPFAGWRSLELSNLKANYDEQKGTDVDARRVTFAGFYGRVLLDPQGRLNLTDVVAKPGDGGTQSLTRDKSGKEPIPLTPQKTAGAAGAASATVAGASAPAAVTAAAASGPAAASPAAASAALPASGANAVAAAQPSSPSAPVRLHFGQLVLQNGSVNYTDNFIKPNYTADLVQIHGTVGAFGTQSTTPAPVDVSAKLAANGPITIKGSVNPLIAKPSLDVTAAAHDIELTNLTPYATKYAGYPITKGKLNVDLHYQLANDQLTANNHLFIDQLTFGDHVDNDTATKLPVRLAISLLKNRNGEIDVNIPVSGSLSNPEFSIGGLIWHAVLNLIAKAVTAPFSLLANAFGGNGQELGYVEFPAGTATLSDADDKKLDTIAKALADKPSVKIDLIGRVDPAVDTPALREQYVDRLVRQQKVKDTVGNGESVDPMSIKVDDKEYEKYLSRAYKAADFRKPRNMIGLTKSLPVDAMKQAIAEHAPVDDAALRGLAQQRAQAVQQYFEGKVDASRVFVVAPKLDAKGIDDKGATTRVDFGLK